MLVAGDIRHFAEAGLTSALHRKQANETGKQRSIDPLPLSGRMPGDDRRLYADRGPHPSDEIPDRNADARRASVRLSSDAHEAGHALRDLIYARQMAVRPGSAKSADAGVDQPRIARREHLVGQSHLFHRAGLEVFDDDVGDIRHLPHQIEGTFFTKIDADAALVAVDGQKRHAFTGVKWRGLTVEIAFRQR